MPTLEFFVIAESISVDQSTNRVSLFNILEEIRPVKLRPNVNYPRNALPQIVAASSWLCEDQEIGKTFEVDHKLILADKEIVELGKMSMRADARRQRVFRLVLACPVKGPGEMKFAVLIDGIEKAHHSVTVHAPPPEENTPAEPTSSTTESHQSSDRVNGE